MAAVGRLHLRQLITYQPASRYWTFQWYETALFGVLTLALAGFCFWWIRHRRLSCGPSRPHKGFPPPLLRMDDDHAAAATGRRDTGRQ